MQPEAGHPLVQLGAKALMLSPKKRLAIGLLLLVTGAALCFDERTQYLPELPWVVMLLGVLVLFSAARARRQHERLEREFAAVLARWDELAAGARAAEAAGHSVVRYLQQQGIDRYEVRRFVLAQLRQQQRPGDDPARLARAKTAADDATLPANLRRGAATTRRPERFDAPPGPPWLPRQ